MNDVREEGAVLATCLMIHHYIPVPSLVGDGILLVLNLEDGQNDFHAVSMLPAVLAMLLMPWAPWSIRPWGYWGVSWHWTSITLKPWSSEGGSIGVGVAYSSCHCCYGPSLFVMYGLIHGVAPDEYASAPPSVHQHSGASLFMGTHPDHRSWMVAKQVDVSKDVRVL